MDDDKPVDATIRPVLPSRAAIPAPMWEEAGAIAGMRQPQDPQAFPLPDVPQPKETPVKKTRITQKPYIRTTKKPDARRSVAARDAWKKRRANLGNPSPANKDELAVLMQMMVLLEKLPAHKRKAVLTLLQGLTS